MSRKEYSRDELQRFFDAVDECLAEPAKIVIVGGSAVILAYGITTTTEDIDTFSNSTKALEAAVELAREKTGMNPPLARSGVAQAPEGYEERLVRQSTSGHFLQLYALEKHDLAISKALRADERDRQHLAALHERDPLDFDTLVARFRDEMLPIYVGDLKPIIDYFLWVVEELFGELKLVQAKRLLGKQKVSP